MRSNCLASSLTILLISHESNATLRSINTCFAAGGFGASKSKANPKKTKNKKVGLLEFAEAPPQPPPSSEPKLDRFGLPVATEDDVFPPLSDDLVRTPATGGKFDRSRVAKSIENHLGVDLSAFDSLGRSLHSEKSRDGAETKWQLHLLHADPPVFQIDDFFSPAECSDCVNAVDPASPSRDESNAVRIASPTFANSVSRRTSTTWFCRYSSVPALLAKAARLLGAEVSRFEEPQIVRYRPGEEFSYHYDEIPRGRSENGGQRLATLLVYLNDLGEGRGGGTVFRDLTMPPGRDDGAEKRLLTVRPSAGRALLFFPSFKDGTPDERTLHRGEVALDTKMIAQLWVHEREYRASVPVGNLQSDAVERVEEEKERLGFS